MSIFIDGYSAHCLHFDGSDDSTTITDIPNYTGWAGNWSCSGTAKLDTAQKKFGTASLLLDGNSDYIQRYADEPGDDVAGFDLTVDMWVRFSSTSGAQTLVSRHTSTDGWRLWWDGTNSRFEFENKTSSSVDVSGTFAATLSTDTWYHIAFVRSGNDHMLFVDGTQAGSTLTDTSPLTDANAYLKIGATVTPANYFNGWIDEFHFSVGIARWTTTFTPEASAYSNGSYDANTLFLAHFNGKDGSGDKGTYCGVRASVGDTNWGQNTKTYSYTSATQKKFGVTSLFMDNTNYPQLRYELASTSDLDLNISAWTIDFWIRIVSSIGTDSWDLLGRFPNSGYADGWSLSLSNGTSFRFQNLSSSSATVDFSKTHGMSADTWYHVALVKNGNDYKMFVDGSQIGTTTTDDSAIVTTTSSPRLFVGRKAIWNTNGPDYYIDELRISNVARWTDTFTPPTSEYAPPLEYSESITDSFTTQDSAGGVADFYKSISDSVGLHGTALLDIEETITESFTLGDDVGGPNFFSESITDSFAVDDDSTGAIGETLSETVADTFAMSDTFEDDVVEISHCDLDQSLYVLTCEGTGDSPYNGSDINLPLITLEATGTISETGYTGDDVSLPVFTAVGYTGALADTDLWTTYTISLSATSADSPTGTAELTLPGFTTNLSGTTEYVGSLTATLPRFRTTSEVLLDTLADLASALPKMTSSSYAYAGDTGEADLEIDGWRLSATGYESGGSVALTGTLPGFYVISTSRGGATGYTQVPVMNTKNSAVTEWNIAFNSLAFFDNKTIATDGSKIYEITGTTDDVIGTNDEIVCNIKTGNLDLANYRTMRFTDAYMNVKADGDLLMQFELDEGSTYDFDVTMHDLVDVHEEKVNLGKGMKARSYAVSLYNVDGSAFVLHRLQLIGNLLD